MTGEPAPGTRPEPRSRAGLDLAALAGAVVLINLPYLSSRFVPGHDAGYIFGIFSYFYNNLLAAHELPLWMAYGTYGIPSGVFQVDFLSASSHFFMALGALFHVRDAHLMFVLSILGEQLLFLLGIYLLSRRLFADRLTVLMVGFAAVCSVLWYWQLFFNFRMQHLIPLALYFLLRFTEERRPEFFWLTGVTLWLGALGCPPYVYPLLALAVGAFAIGLGSAFWRALPSLFGRSWRNAAALGTFVLAGAAVTLLLHQALDGIKILTPDRDSDSGRVLLQQFLVYGGTTPPGIFGSFLGFLPTFSGGGVDQELTHYIGILPLAGLPLAVLRCRNRTFVALALMAAAMLLLSLGGTFACLAYRFPLMTYFRHVGYVTSIAKVALLLAGGFGIDELLRALAAGPRWDRRTRFGALAALGIVLWILLDAQIGGRKLATLLVMAKGGSLVLEDWQEVLAAALRVLVYGGAAALVLWPARAGGDGSAFASPTLRKALLAVALVDGLIYQSQIVARMPRCDEPPPLPAGTMTYRERRGEPLDPRLESWIKRWEDPKNYGAGYQIAFCAMYQLDPAKPLAREDWLARAPAELRNTQDLALRKALPTLLGVTAPKLRLVSRAVHVDSAEEAARAVAGRESFESLIVLRGAPADLRAAAGEEARADGEVRVREFSANRLLAEVTRPAGAPAWLLYADAFHPGWRASVNGQAAPVVEANLAFKAVRVPGGTSTVCFSYSGGSRAFGACLLTVVSALFVAAALATLVRVAASGVRGKNPTIPGPSATLHC